MLELRTFGTIDLRSGDGPVDSVLSQPVRVALLTYLAVERPRGPHRRGVLTHLLWPERDEATARRNLRQNLYRLRQSLGDDVVAGHGEQSVGLAPGALWCDAVEFEEALEEGRPADAMELYRGPFLKGFHVPGAIEFERWADRQRDRFARAAEKAAWSLSEDAEAEGDVRRGERWARKAIDLNPFEERGWRRLMELLDRHGERAGAVRAYEELKGRLEEELGVEPSPETRETVERIRTRRTPAGPRDEGDGGGDGAGPSEPGREDGGEPRGRPAGQDTADVRNGGSGPRSVGSEKSTIAVLPFLDLSPGEEGGQHFGDGLAEELITTLGQLEDLRVVARTSAFAFRGEERDVREIGEALGTTALVEGSVRIEDGRLRVAAQLVNTEDGVQIWSESYDRELTDVFEVQKDLALRIAEALQTRLSPAERRRLSRQPTASPEAYNDYLRGRHFWNRRSGEGLDRALDYFERALDAAPDFARAHAGLASVFAPAGELGYLPPDRARERMRGAMERALELDEHLAEAHTARGGYLYLYEWNWDDAARAYQRAIELDPDYGTARLWYAYLLDALGRLEEAIELGETALERDPLAPVMSNGLAGSHRLAGDFGPALDHYEHALELDPGFWLVHENVGKLHEQRGDPEAAEGALRRAVEHAGPTPRPRAGLARVLAVSGDTAEAREIVEEIREQASEEDNHFPEVATALEALGDTDAAFAWLGRSYEQRHPRLQHLGVDPAFDRLRDDPRFRDLLGRIGLPE